MTTEDVRDVIKEEIQRERKPRVLFWRADFADTPPNIGKNTLMRGTVTRFDPKRGFGFLRMEDGFSIFIHQRDLIDRYSGVPNVGDTVTFKVGQDKNDRKCAVEARLDGRPAPADLQPNDNANRVPTFGDYLPPRHRAAHEV